MQRDWSVVSYNENSQATEVEGPDGQSVNYAYDDLGRVATAIRSGMEIDYVYDDASRLIEEDYGNGAKVFRYYDEADRLTSIAHEDSSTGSISQIDYDWNLDDTVASRTETDASAQGTTTTFSYDDRQQLIGETRQVSGGSTVYDIAYEYDQLGNRTTRTDAGGYTYEYTYDTDGDPNMLAYPTQNNRLLSYVVKSGGTTLRTVNYTYYLTGDVSNITIKDNYVSGVTPGSAGDYDWYYDLAFTYFTNGTVRWVLQDKWKVSGGSFTDYTPLTACEFRYDSPRARYIALDYNTGGDPDQANWTLAANPLMTDYAGVTAYGDFELSYSSGAYRTSEQRRYLDGECHETTGGSPAQTYWHGDLIASTFATSDSGGGLADAMAYTAFGERINLGDGSPPASFPRYQYAGGFGYESGLILLSGANTNLPAITLQHLGARWYDPSLGRFVQRDPIGIVGGRNVYAYASVNPPHRVDPSGLIQTDEQLEFKHYPRDKRQIGFIGCGFPLGPGLPDANGQVPIWEPPDAAQILSGLGKMFQTAGHAGEAVSLGAAVIVTYGRSIRSQKVMDCLLLFACFFRVICWT